MNAKRIVAIVLPLVLSSWLASTDSAEGQTTRKTETTIKTKERAKAKATAVPNGSIDVNSATEAELTTLAGIGPAHARKIIDGRPYASLDDLAGAGLSAAMIAKIKPSATANPLPPAVDVNAATADRLETLPGVGPALAKAIIAGRPYKTFADLAKVKGLGPAKLDELRGRVKLVADAPVPAVGEKARARVVESKDQFRTKTADAKAAMKAKGADVKEKVETKTKSKGFAPLAAAEKININTAGLDELQRLIGIGPVKAQAILDARKAAPFATIDDVKKVRGIKDGEFAKIKDHIKVK